MSETAHFRGEVIERLVDRLSPGAWYERRLFVTRHGPILTRPARPHVIERALAFLRERGAREIRHPGGYLLSHLLCTLQLLREWGAPESQTTSLRDRRGRAPGSRGSRTPPRPRMTIRLRCMRTPFRPILRA
jgi:hypothetical protein